MTSAIPTISFEAGMAYFHRIRRGEKPQHGQLGMAYEAIQESLTPLQRSELSPGLSELKIVQNTKHQAMMKSARIARQLRDSGPSTSHDDLTRLTMDDHEARQVLRGAEAELDRVTNVFAARVLAILS